MIARNMAALLWSSKTRTPLSVPVQYELRRLYTHMANFATPWEMCIGHTVPRDAQFTSIGDACLTGGGAYCDVLEFWFDIIWSADTSASLKSKKLHINVMEFIVVILQLAAVVTLTEECELYPPCDPPSLLESQHWRTSSSEPTTPHPKIGLTKCRPKRKWANCSSAFMPTSSNGRRSLSTATILPANLADFISCPPFPIPPLPTRHQQIFTKEPRLASFRYFRPSQELLSLLGSRLSTKQWQESLPLPKSLGHFLAAGSTISCFASI